MSVQSLGAGYTFESFETRGGARIFRIPMHVFPDLWAYAYLVLVKDQVVLIDTGSGFGDSNTHLAAGFIQAGSAMGKKIQIEDLTHILITHGHIDHFGGLMSLREQTKALVGIHELDMGILTRYEERVAIAENRLKTYLVETGVPEEEREGVLNMYQLNKSLAHSVSVDFTFEAKGMHLGDFEMLHVPGHCAGHVVIRLDDILFSGDHVLGKITPHQSPESLTYYNGLGHYLDSLTLLDKWAGDVSLTLAGHDDPIVDLKKRIGEIRRAHTGRLEKTLEFFGEPHTVAEVSRELFGKVKGYDSLLAIEEAGAHVEYLHQRSMLRIVNVEDLEANDGPVVLLYRRINSPVTQKFGLA